MKIYAAFVAGICFAVSLLVYGDKVCFVFSQINKFYSKDITVVLAGFNSLRYSSFNKTLDVKM